MVALLGSMSAQRLEGDQFDNHIEAIDGNLTSILDNGVHLAQTMSFDELDRCLDLITHNGAKTLNLEDPYGIEGGKPANFLVLYADLPCEAVRQRADVLASIRNGAYLFKRPEPSYEIALDLFRKTIGRRCEMGVIRGSQGPLSIQKAPA